MNAQRRGLRGRAAGRPSACDRAHDDDRTRSAVQDRHPHVGDHRGRHPGARRRPRSHGPVPQHDQTPLGVLIWTLGSLMPRPVSWDPSQKGIVQDRAAVHAALSRNLGRTVAPRARNTKLKLVKRRGCMAGPTWISSCACSPGRCGVNQRESAPTLSQSQYCKRIAHAPASRAGVPLLHRHSSASGALRRRAAGCRLRASAGVGHPLVQLGRGDP